MNLVAVLVIATILLGATITPSLAFVTSSTSNPLLSILSPGSFGDTPAAQNKGKSASAKDLTLTLLKLSKQYDGASEEEKPGLLQKIVGLAQQRKFTLVSMIESDPGTVLEVSLPNDLKQQMPLQAHEHIEEFVDLEGELQVLHSDDFDTGDSRLYHFLHSPAGEISLHFVGDAPFLNSGSSVLVHGVLIAKKMAVPDQEGSFEVLSTAQALQIIRKVAVILFNFQNNPTQPYTPESARGVTFTNSNSANAYYKQISFNKLGLEGYFRSDGDIYGWYTVPIDSTNCPYSTASSYARQQAAADGFNINNYNNVIYAFPSTANCPGWGWAYINGKESWVQGSYALRVVGHELGHNFGVHHASSYRCTENGVNVAISNNCTRSEYGDPFDIMGSSTNHMNNFHKGRLNYLDSYNTQTVTTDGTYTISQIEQSSTSVQALRIPRDFASNGSVTKYYYLEYRQPYGFDNFSSNSAVSNGVSIRLAPPYTTVIQTWLIDATPSTSSFTDSALTVGSIFEDLYKGIVIRTLSKDNNEATVSINFGTGTCFRADPSVSIAPSSQWGFPGDALNYNVSVTNNDSSACAPSTFTINPSLPDGWLQTPSAPSVFLYPSTGATVTVSITSPSSAEAGFYTFSETATNNSDSSYSNIASASYNVKIPDTTPPAVTITNPADKSKLPSKGSVKVTISASDESGIAKIQIFINNSSVKVCSNSNSCQYNWAMSGVSAGTYEIRAEATDKAPAANTNIVSITVYK